MTYDVLSLTADTTGIHYGSTTVRVNLAIGPAQFKGYVLVTDGQDTFEVIASQLRISN